MRISQEMQDYEANHARELVEADERKQECARATIAASQILESVIDDLAAPWIRNRELCRSQLQDAAAELAIVCEYVREEVL